MAKKHKKGPQAPMQPPRTRPWLSRRGKRLFAAGIVCLAVGFALLAKTDRYGRNWAAHAAPFLILGGYGSIAAAFLAAEEPGIPGPSDPSV